MEVTESLISTPTPSSNSVPGFNVKEMTRRTELGLDEMTEYTVDPEWEKIFDKIKNDLTPEERKQKKIKMTINCLKILTLWYLHRYHTPDPEKKSFYLLENTLLGNIHDLDRLDIM